MERAGEKEGTGDVGTAIGSLSRTGEGVGTKGVGCGEGVRCRVADMERSDRVREAERSWAGPADGLRLGGGVEVWSGSMLVS